ncbi:MAG: type II toxin-antitoxin system HicA family toxin [Cyclobacteriaceae bacterium]
MKLPRDVSGKQLIKALNVLGYEVTRQSGSHIRLTTQQQGTHHITIPDHHPLKIGTLSNILKEVAAHFRISKDEVIEKIF